MRGDVYELKAPRGTRGHEQSGRRLAVIVQSDEFDFSTWIVAPTSTSARPMILRPEIQVGDLSTLVLTEQMTTIEPSRLGRQVGHLGLDERREVDSAHRLVLQL